MNPLELAEAVRASVGAPLHESLADEVSERLLAGAGRNALRDFLLRRAGEKIGGSTYRRVRAILREFRKTDGEPDEVRRLVLRAIRVNGFRTLPGERMLYKILNRDVQ